MRSMDFIEIFNHLDSIDDLKLYLTLISIKYARNDREPECIFSTMLETQTAYSSHPNLNFPDAYMNIYRVCMPKQYISNAEKKNPQNAFIISFPMHMETIDPIYTHFINSKYTQYCSLIQHHHIACKIQCCGAYVLLIKSYAIP